MPIPINTYFIVTPSSQFISKAYSSLQDFDLFFYVNETSSLRVVNMQSGTLTATPGSINYTLAQGVSWVGVVSQPGVAHTYYADQSGVVWHLDYRVFGGTPPTPTHLVNLSPEPVQTFSVIYTPQTTPPAYMMMTFDGVFHRIFVASDPLFQDLLAPSQVTYNNALAPTFFVSQPNIAMHPLDTVNVCVICQQLNENNSVVQVGFYGVAAPGLS